MKVSKTRAEALKKARARVETAYGAKPGEREWLVGNSPDSYESENYRTEIHVLEGSPPKGYVVAASYNDCQGSATAFSLYMERLGAYRWDSQ